MNYNRGDVVLLYFPFITTKGAQQKVRPALIISDHFITRRFDDFILVGITSQRVEDVLETEFLIEEGTNDFKQSGLIKTSVVRCEYIMTIPKEVIARKLGKFPDKFMNEVDNRLKLNLGLKIK